MTHCTCFGGDYCLEHNESEVWTNNDHIGGLDNDSVYTDNNSLVNNVISDLDRILEITRNMCRGV